MNFATVLVVFCICMTMQECQKRFYKHELEKIKASKVEPVEPKDQEIEK